MQNDIAVKQFDEKTRTLTSMKVKQVKDIDTGEIIELNEIIKVAYGQKAFWKVYLMDFLQILGGFEYKQLDVLLYILDHTNPSNNTFIGTYEKISKGANVSIDTVRRCIKLVTAKGFMKKIQIGVYMVSPDIMLKGNEHKKQMLLSYYTDPSEEI